MRNTVARAITKICRHTAINHKLAIRDDGYIILDDMLNLQMFKKWNCTVDNVKQIVEECPKQRMQLND